MKKIVSLAIACMLLLSCFAINAFAAVTTFDITASEPDADGVFEVTFTSPVELKLAMLTMSYPKDKMDVVDATTGEIVTGTADGVALNVITYTPHDQKQSKLFDGFVNAYTFASSNDNLAEAGDIFSIQFKLKDGAKIEANPFALVGNDVYRKGYGGINAQGASTTNKYRVSADTAAASFDWEAIKYEEPVVENPFSATVAGTTITCAGRVDAASTNYGVIFTADSTVTGDRAQKYYGAMNGDTVAANKEATSTTVFNFDGWDGTFEIILENVSAGSKTLDFFVNDTVIADTNFTVVVE